MPRYNDLNSRLDNSVVTMAAQSGAVAIDATAGSNFLVQLTGNATSWSITGVVQDGVEITVMFAQDATGSRTLASAASTIKLAGGAITLTTAASKTDILVFKRVGLNWLEIARSMAVAT